ncbi:hypothetical protein P8935_19640 [Telmatobacter sp. DSM 110680]|uniref:Zinc resistance-associated protein n=1 Tax=Telmatobacter sp. DSM 110680 TaxID=3036704 RepID=A0AAU7DI86_9BACT
MKQARRLSIAGMGMAGLALAGALLGWAQYSPTGGGSVAQSIPGPRPLGVGGGIENDPVFGAKRLRAMNADRQKSMVSDTDKLVKLARQLDAEIASNPTDDLTPEELHKVAEIEKLARNVKAKMAQSFDVGPKVGSQSMPLGGPNQW